MNIKRKDSPSGRTYQIGDNEYPSVTSVLSLLSKPALVYWSANLVIDYLKSICEEGVECDWGEEDEIVSPK